MIVRNFGGCIILLQTFLNSCENYINGNMYSYKVYLDTLEWHSVSVKNLGILLYETFKAI